MKKDRDQTAMFLSIMLAAIFFVIWLLA